MIMIGFNVMMEFAFPKSGNVMVIKIVLMVQMRTNAHNMNLPPRKSSIIPDQ